MVTGNLQIKDGKYYAVVNLRDETGKRKQKWVSTGLPVRGNKKNAEQFLNQELEKWNYHNGVYYGISVAEYFEIWLTEIEKEVRPNTFRSYKGNMTNHIIPYFRNTKIQLQSIKPIDLEDYYFSLLRPESNLENGAALSATTIRHHHQNISKALADAVRKGYIPLNPASSARLPKKEKYKAEFLNHEQLDELISLFKGSPVELPVRLCAIYGFRRSEVLGLKWKNVDFINRTITISETLQQHTGGNYTDHPKTESSYRTLPLNNTAYDLLKEQKKLQDERKLLMGNYYIYNDYVCTWGNGEVIAPNYLTRTFHSVIQNSTLPQIRLHDLRHSVASNLLNLGFSVVQVQEWLGHGSASTTLNFYAHVDKSSKISIADTLDKLNSEQEKKEDKVLEKVSEEKTLSETKKDPVKGSKKGLKKAKISTKVVPIKKQSLKKC